MDLIFPGRKARSSHVSFVDDEQKNVSDMQQDGRRDLLQKSGFLSLQERLSNLTRVSKNDQSRRKNETTKVDHTRTGIERNKLGDTHRPQFATLHELFSNINHQKSQIGSGGRRKPKIPVMKLDKNDWNVRCWEDRVQGIKREPQCMNAIDIEKPEHRVDAFNSRIDDVATKLQKIREGAPLDERLYELVKMDNKIGSMKPKLKDDKKHEWTDLLKDELQRRIHDQKVLKSELDRRYDALGQRKSPLGRPIGRILAEDDSDEGEAEN